MLAQVMKATEEDHWFLNTILALVVSFVPPDVQPPALALPGPWQSPEA